MKKIILMMPVLVLLVAQLLIAPAAHAQSGEKYVEQMHARNKDNWYRSLTFTQDTEFYRNDSLIRKQVWYEMVRFPYELRIDVDSISGGNKTYYKKDSTYRIRKNKIAGAGVDPNPFIFFLGGMYMLPLDTVKAQLKQNGYDLSLGGITNWKGRKTFIIGAANDTDTSRNQFWVDAQHLYIVRVKLKLGNTAFDIHLLDHQKLDKGWSETTVRFYREGKLLQTEKYRDIKTDVKLGDEVFDVEKYR
jgi:hypothetical protein